MKNIVLITSSFPYGGASANLLRYFSFCLKDAGNNVEVILPLGSYYGNKIDQQSIRCGVVNGVKYRRLSFIYHPKNYLGKIIEYLAGLVMTFIYLFYRSVNMKLDIIIVYKTMMSSLIIYIICAKLLRKELILIIPEFYEKPKSNLMSIKTLQWYNFYFGIKYFARYAKKFIVLSTFLKKYLEKKFISSNRIFIMPNLTDPTRFNNQDINPFKKGYITIGYVGTPTKKDGILDLIKSFSILIKKYPKIKLLVIGDVTNGNTVIPELREYASKQGIKDSEITFTGLVSHTQIPNLLLSCQILALTRPSGIFAEAGFPTKLGEYFACKKPVVITKVGDMKYYLQDKKDVVFANPGDTDSIYEAFEYLITNPERAYLIGINGFNWMNDFLNYKNQFEKINKFVLSDSII